MNKELVEKLKNKDYVREFGRMSEEERELYKKVGARNCVRYSSVLSICGWYDAFDFCERFSYAIKSDYQPEYKDIAEEDLMKFSNSICSCKSCQELAKKAWINGQVKTWEYVVSRGGIDYEFAVNKLKEVKDILTNNLL